MIMTFHLSRVQSCQPHQVKICTMGPQNEGDFLKMGTILKLTETTNQCESKRKV